MNKYQKLHITLNNIHELNHFVCTHSQRHNIVGKNYTALHFHGAEAKSEEDPWLYKINRHGYRGEDWPFNRRSIGFFGCSFTFGIGVEQSISDRVQEKLSIRCINLGLPGASPILVLKTFISFLKLHPIDFAVITLPPISRIHRPVYDSKILSWNYESFLPDWIPPCNNKIYTVAYEFFTEDTSAAYLYDYINSIETLANYFGTKILWSSWDIETQNFLIDIAGTKKIIQTDYGDMDKARDNMHPGPKSVEKWAGNLSQEITTNFLSSS